MDNINTSNRTIEVTYKERDRIFYNSLKRVFDVVLSLIAIVLLSPVFIIVALIIRLDSKGKIVFGHERIGQGMKKIKVYKFRSMYENSEEIFNNFTEEQKKEYYT